MTHQTNNRFLVVDALRGFAIVSIMLLHNIEHFDLYVKATSIPDWMIPIDTAIWDILFFLFAGKSFAIFAYLFGLTFYIQHHNQAKKGVDFRARFAWRMILLLGFGLINSAFFHGDILSIYAVIGLFLIPMVHLKNNVLIGIAIVLLLQPVELLNLVSALQHPEVNLPNPSSWMYFGRSWEYMKAGTLWEVMWGNLTNGKKAVLMWNLENGRYFQILALFILGMVSGRKQLFKESKEHYMFWVKCLFSFLLSFAFFFLLTKNLDLLTSSGAVKRSLRILISSWSNLSFMMVLVSGFVLLFYTNRGAFFLNKLSPLGKMSLSNYVFQSIVGSTIYYGFGLGMWEYTGATYAFLIGMLLTAIFIYLCTWWANHHKHGPLEGVWHKLTWLGSKR